MNASHQSIQRLLDPPTVSIFEVPIWRSGLNRTLEFCRSRLAEGRGGHICFVNVHTLTESTQNPPLKKCMQEALVNAPDGVPVYWATKIKAHHAEGRVCGPDFMLEALQRWKDIPHGFIGGLPGVSEKIINKYGIKGVSYSPPLRPFSKENAEADWREFMQLCQSQGQIPKIVWVGLGAPKQEYWIHHIGQIAPDTIFCGVGAAFDFLGHTKKRAPRWMQKVGIEWVHRLISEPGRLWKRYLLWNSRFIWQLVREWASGGGSR